MTSFGRSAMLASPTLDTPWWQRAVIYHLYLPSFRDSNGDGIGDLPGVTAGLDYLRDVLGVDAIWVSPFFSSPMLDGGYDIEDHCAVHPQFGTIDDVDELLAEAHHRGLRVLIDYVPNHTSDRHPWFVAARAERSSPMRDWYVWADGRDGGPPNNWLSEAGGSAWEHDQPTGQYYLHSHMVSQPDLNWRNPAVRKAMLQVLRFWLDRGVDGFRIDVAHMLMKDPELRDNPPNPDGVRNPWDRQAPDFHTQLHVHDRRHPDLHGVLRLFRELLDSYRDRIAIGEIEVMSWRDWADYYGADLDELHLPLNFRLIETHWRADEVRETIEALEAAVPSGACAIQNLGNHDRSRTASRYGQEQARVAAMLLLTLRGSPLLYYGEELGMADVDVPPHLRRDGFDLGDAPSRDVNRTPMQWEPGPGAGFTSADEPWLPFAPDADRVNVEAQLADPASALNLYRRLIALRREHAALRDGSLRFTDPGAEDCLVYVRETTQQRIAVALNLAGRPAAVPLPVPGRLLLSTRPDRPAHRTDATLVLDPNEGCVVTLG